MTVLKSERLILRKFEKNDAFSLVKHANNRNVSQFLMDRFPYPYTLKDAEEWISFVEKKTPVTNFVIELDQEVVGGIGLTQGFDIYCKSAELGYWLGESHWGKGVMTEAIGMITAYGFEKLGIVRIYGGVFENNLTSARVLEKAGFTLESRLKKSVFKFEKMLDQLMYVKILAD